MDRLAIIVGAVVMFWVLRYFLDGRSR